MTARKRIFSAIIFAVLAFSAPAKEKPPVGQQPPEWTVTNWIHSAPLRLAGLRGNVVLVRWWTAPSCPYCKASAPALQEFHRDYQSQGLRVIGFYHHKASEPLDPAKVRTYADDLGFKFPVAIDADWKTLNEWWLNSGKQKWTSVSFLIDKRGVVRHVHPGGDIVKGRKDYEQLRRKIDQLLAEK